MKTSYGRILTTVGLMLSAATVGAQSPQKLVDELLSVDREHAKRARNVNVLDALGGMFAEDVALNAMGAFHFGREAALARLRTVPENVTGRLEWAPIRGAISGDGQHGFTYGFMTLVRADSTRLPLKYLA